MIRGARQVANYARRMVRQLNTPKNAAKPGWDTMTFNDLLIKLDEEYDELVDELVNLVFHADEMTAYEINNAKRRVAEESTDMGNVSMMICDKAGGLDE